MSSAVSPSTGMDWVPGDITQFESLFGQAKEAENYGDKKAKYDEAFRLLITQGDLSRPEVRGNLFPLFASYASDMCYARPGPEDSSEGFKKAGALLEWTIYTRHLNLSIGFLRWKESIDEVILDLRMGSQDLVFAKLRDLLMSLHHDTLCFKRVRGRKMRKRHS